ncbi:unnamed protein product [Spirodela intermedia]|uniref:Uncharacterized protein n=1 Tax=Spirodela intermedia TaxID=51605 RepID=A0A7I8IKD7_SPIIN|nr:unnamed protein product [Spirodela intermedia]CAA6657833.1 unnamed protein product [Spirodela intermedia]
MWRRTMASAGVLPTAYYSSDPFDFILEECGNISAAQAAVHRRSRFLREEEEDDALPADAPAYRSPARTLPPPAAAPMLPRRSSRSSATSCASASAPPPAPPAPPAAAWERGRGASNWAFSFQWRKGEGLGLEEEARFSSFPPPPFVSMADDRAVKKKPPYAQPNVPVRTGDESSSQAARRVFAGDTGPSPPSRSRGGPVKVKRALSRRRWSLTCRWRRPGEASSPTPSTWKRMIWVRLVPPGPVLRARRRWSSEPRHSRRTTPAGYSRTSTCSTCWRRSVRLPDPEWWRPSGYGPSSSSSPPGDDHREKYR